MLRMVELTGHGKVPVSAGAELPLINSRDETEMWEGQCGEFSYKGAWNPARYHEPNEVPTPAAGATRHQASRPARRAADDRDHPQASERGHALRRRSVHDGRAGARGSIRKSPAWPRELVLMGAGFNVDKGGNHRINGRREFNWWWDPEATRMAMSAPWKKITITPVDISVKTTLSDDVKAQVGEIELAGGAVPHQIRAIGKSIGGGGYMWDEIAAVALIDPSIITKQQELYVNIDIDHGASYGQTIFVEADMPGQQGQPPTRRKMAPWWRVATVHWDLDLHAFLRQVRRTR